MITRSTKHLLTTLLFVSGLYQSQAQVSSIPASGAVRQSFNSMSAGTALPAGWRRNSTAGAGTTSISFSAGGTASVANVASSGSPVTGGSYNWGTTAGTDRAIGFMSSSGWASPNCIMVDYNNQTGSTITSLTITYKVERYRVNSGTASINLYSSTTGNSGTWTAQPTGDVSAGAFPTGASVYTFNTPTTNYKSVTISGLSIANGADYYFMWVMNTNGGDNSQAIALDDVNLYAGYAATKVTATLDDALLTDVNGNTVVNEGDSIGYTAKIQNNNSGNITSATYTNPLVTNTQFNSGTVKTSALANDDNYSTAVSTNITGATTVLGNDFGVPSPTVTSFGNTENSAATVANGSNTITTDNGGTVMMNTNGTFNYTVPGAQFVGPDRFAYTATNGNAPNNNAVVNVNVGSALTGVGDGYNVTGNVPISVPAGNGVLINDGNGGAGSSVVTVAGLAANVGIGTTTVNGGSITLNADGSFVYKPPVGFEGSDNVVYTADNGFGIPTSSVTITFTITNSIWFIDNSAGSAGDGRLGSPFNTLAAFQAVNNNTGSNPSNGDVIYMYSGSGNYTGGVTLLSNQKLIGAGATDGSFALATGITPATYSFNIPTTGGSAPSITGTGVGVQLNSAGTANTVKGLTIQSSPTSAMSGSGFGTLTVADVTINNATAQALNLTNGTVNGTFPSVTSGGGTNNVAFTNCAGNTTISGGTLSGATGASFLVSGGSISITKTGGITQSNNAALLNVTGGHTGTLTFQTGTLSATNGTGLQFDNADGTYNFNGTCTLNGGDAGIDIINGSGGNFSFTNAPVTNPSGVAININGGNGTISHTGAISKTSAGNIISISNRNGGSVTLNSNITSSSSATGISLGTNSAGAYSFAGAISATAAGQVGLAMTSNTGGTYTFSNSSKVFTTTTAAAVNLATNTGCTIGFTGGGLAITTTTGNGFAATGGATSVIVTGTSNTISSTGGVAFNISNSTIGASGVTFQSIASNGGSNGIILNTTGASGGLTVTGLSNSWGSGGTIQNTTGADGATAGNGIYLNSANHIALSYMQINDHGNNAIYGNTVSHFTMFRTRVIGTNGNNPNGPYLEGSLFFDNLLGNDTIKNSYLSGGTTDNLKINGSSGTLNRLYMTLDTLGNQGTLGNDAILFSGTGTGIINATVENCVFTAARANHIAYIMNTSSGGNIVINNNNFTNSHPNIVSGNTTIYVGTASNTAVTYTISNNTINTTRGSAIEADRLAGGSGSMTGSITGNFVGTTGVANSGSSEGSGIFVAVVGNGTTATHTTTVSNNTVRQFSNYGIAVVNRGTGTGYLDATVTNNNISTPSPNAAAALFPTNGVFVNLGTTSGPPPDDGKLCLSLTGNTINQCGTNGGAEVRVRARFSTKISIPGLSGTADAFINSNNTITIISGGTAVFATSTTGFQSSCPPL